MIKLFNHSHTRRTWEVFPGSRDQAIAFIKRYLEDQDMHDCDTCWEDRFELYDSDADDVTVFTAYYSGWSDGEKIYPVEIEQDDKEPLKVRLSTTYVNRKWEHYLTQLDPRRDYIIV